MIETTEQGWVVRQGTTDVNHVLGLANDEYRLAGRNLTGWAIDVGAHMGTVAITMAQQNPGLRVLAVEAVPENADLLERNIRHFGLMDRVIPVRAWAAGPNDLTGVCHYGYRHRETESDGYVSAHRFVGNTWVDMGDPEFSVEMPAVSLGSLMAEHDIKDLALLKIDCEGCEWAFLDTPAIAKVQTIVGEYHGGYPGHRDFQVDPRASIVDLLGATHFVEFWSDEPTVGLFEAVRPDIRTVKP
jgi:FkbM family methyltransferase